MIFIPKTNPSVNCHSIKWILFFWFLGLNLTNLSFLFLLTKEHTFSQKASHNTNDARCSIVIQPHLTQSPLFNSVPHADGHSFDDDNRRRGSLKGDELEVKWDFLFTFFTKKSWWGNFVALQCNLHHMCPTHSNGSWWGVFLFKWKWEKNQIKSCEVIKVSSAKQVINYNYNRIMK